MPPRRLALGQIAIATIPLLLVSAVLHQMLAATSDIAFLPVAAAYVTGNTAGILSHVPGGPGVIEAVLLWGRVPTVVGALVAFRRFLVPFFIGGLVLGVSEIVRRHHRRSPDPRRWRPS